MKKYLMLALIYFISSNIVYGQELAKVGTAGYQFLKVGMDARGAALGDAVSPMTDDSRAVFWNPVMLTKMNDWSVAFTHSRYLAGMSMEGFSLGKTLPGIGTIALFGTFFNSGDMEETTVAQQNGTGRMFQSQSYSAGVSFARMLTEKFGMGVNIKYVSEDLTNGQLDEDNSTSSWAVDIGSVYYPRFNFAESFRLVMYIRNFGPEIQLAGTHIDFDQGQQLPDPVDFSIFQMPLNFYFGFGYDLWDSDANKITFAALLEHPNDNEERGNFGLEYMWNNLISLRGGYVLNHDSRSLSGGVGFNLKTFDTFTLKLDYAYVDYGVLDDIQYFTVAIDW